MPYGGLGSFLLIDYEYSDMNIQLVSMPYLGLLPFLQSQKLPMNIGWNCFNALLRASFFSTQKKLNWMIRFEEKVSMPYFGLLSFLRGDDVMVDLKKKVVSMPYFGLLSFLQEIIRFTIVMKS